MHFRSLLAILGLWAAASPSVRADFDLAEELYREKNFTAAATEFRRLAELGEGHSQFNLGVMYYKGEGVAKDLALAFAWLSLAAEQDAMNSAKVRDKIFAKLDTGEQARGRQQAEAIRTQYGQDALAKRLLPELREDPEYWASAKAVKKHPPGYPREAAMKGVEGVVALKFHVGADGSVRDAAVEYAIPKTGFNKAALMALRRWRFEAKPSSSEKLWQRVVIDFRMASDATSIVKPEAMNQILQAAEAGSPRAQMIYSQALMLHEVAAKAKNKNPTYWLSLAAQGGDAEAQYSMGSNLIAGAGCRSDQNKGAAWLQLSAQGGNAEAQYELAQLILNDPGHKHDREKARHWLTLAAEANHALAQRRLAWELATDPEPARRDGHRALALAQAAAGSATKATGRPVAKALESEPEVWETLAAAQAELGQFHKAVELQREAIDEARFRSWDVVAMKQRLIAYQEGKPWRDPQLAAR
ncbi:MAG: TonB family protein [Gammaproteobacteria bacterium]|nr:TonB family protein [Gammaproteobacteria bacterium]